MIKKFSRALRYAIISPLFLCMMLVLATAGNSMAQKKANTDTIPKTTPDKKVKWNNSLSASLHIDQLTGTQTLMVDTNGVLQLDALPEVLMVDLPVKNLDKLSLIFNKEGKTRFILSMDPADSIAGKGLVPQLHLSDIRFGRLELYFHEGELIRIGDRFLVERPKVEKTKPYIKINLPVDKEPEAESTRKPAKVKQEPLPPYVKSELDAMLKCLLCYAYPKCDSTKDCTAAQKPGTEKSNSGKDSPVVNAGNNTKKDDSYSNNWFSKMKRRYRPVTVIDWNQDNNKQTNYLLYPDGKLKEIIDIRRRQKMMSWIIVRISSQDSTTPKLLVNGLASSKFDPTDAQVKALDNLGEPSGGSTPPAPSVNDSTKAQPQSDSTVQPKAPIHPDKVTDSIVMVKSQLFVSLKDQQKDSLLKAYYMKANSTNSSAAFKNLTALFPKYKKEFLQTMNKDLDSLVKIVDSIISPPAKVKPPNKPGTPSITPSTTQPKSFGVEWKTKLIALDMVLQEFNTRFASIDFRAAEYNRKLTDLKEGMKYCLGMVVADNEDDFKKSLLRIINTGADSANLDELTEDANNVAAEYKKAIHKTSTRSVKYLYAQVPDADQFNLQLSTEKPSKDVFTYTFPVVGGFKIDVSTGPFFSGLHNSTYTLFQSRFSYADSRDSTFRRVTGEAADTAILTGKTVDTSGYLIKTNRNRLSYGVGFFAHGYWRSGGALNSSLTMGFVLNNDGQVFGMLGVSALFANLKNRLVVTIGGCIGKVKTVSSSVSSYQYKSEYAVFENGRQVYLNRREVPRFYNTSATTEVPMYDKLKLSYFLALSFNLGNVKQ